MARNIPNTGIAQAATTSGVADPRDFSSRPVEILIQPIGRARYQVQRNGRLIIGSMSEPLLAAARALLAEGVASGTVLAMRHAGSDHVALVAWRDGRDAGISPPARFLGDPAPDIAVDLTVLHGDEVTV